jgi:methionyl-tRNA formyltransferase
MRIIFMGTPDFAVPSLNALVVAGHDVCAVYCQPPRPAGRGKGLMPSAVHRRAEALGIPVMTPTTLKGEEAQAVFSAFQADLAVVAAYGLLLPKSILSAPKLGCLNVHGSLLPRWRGAAPIHRAILAGDKKTGVTIMDMDAGLDTGAMRATVETEIGSKTTPMLTAELADLGAALLCDVIGNWAAYPPIAQPETGITYATKIDKSENHLDFLVSAPQVERQIRAFAPFAWFGVNGERVRIVAADIRPPRPARDDIGPATTLDDHLTIACNPGAICPTVLQRAGKSSMPAVDVLRGFKIVRGTRLS